MTRFTPNQTAWRNLINSYTGITPSKADMPNYITKDMIETLRGDIEYNRLVQETHIYYRRLLDDITYFSTTNNKFTKEVARILGEWVEELRSKYSREEIGAMLVEGARNGWDISPQWWFDSQGGKTLSEIQLFMYNVEKYLLETQTMQDNNAYLTNISEVL